VGDPRINPFLWRMFRFVVATVNGNVTNAGTFRNTPRTDL
jgi:hypothetical protein